MPATDSVILHLQHELPLPNQTICTLSSTNRCEYVEPEIFVTPLSESDDILDSTAYWLH